MGGDNADLGFVMGAAEVKVVVGREDEWARRKQYKQRMRVEDLATVDLGGVCLQYPVQNLGVVLLEGRCRLSCWLPKGMTHWSKSSLQS